MSLALHYWMGDAHHCSMPPSPKWPILYYTVSSGTLNSTIAYNTLCASQRTISCVSYAQSSVRCRSTLPRCWSRHLCHHVWTTVTASWSESLTVWCDGCRQSRTPLHVWLPALADRPHHSYSPAASLAAGPSTYSVQAGHVSFQNPTLFSPQFLVDDCQLVTASSRRQLRSSDVNTCVIQRSSRWSLLRCRWTTSMEQSPCRTSPHQPLHQTVPLCAKDTFV